MRRLLVAFSLLLPLGLAAQAAAAPVDLGVKTDALDVAMTKDGAAHVARLITVAPLTPGLVVCRIPAGGTACAQTVSRPLPDDTGVVGDPHIVTDGTRVTAVVGYGNGATGRTFATSSANGVGGWSALQQVANVNAADVELAPAGDRLWISASEGPKPVNGDYLAFTSAPLPGGAAQTGAAVLGRATGGRSIDGLEVGVTPAGRPLAFLAGNAPDLASGDYFRPFTGTPTSTAELVDASKWGPPVPIAPAAPNERNGGYDVASGSGRLWLAYEGLGKDTLLRSFNGTTFGPPVAADCVASRFTSGTQESPDVAITRTGDLLVAEVGTSGGTVDRLAFFHGRPDGSAFSPYQELATGPGIEDVEIAADPTSDAGGVVAWTTDAIDDAKGELFFARLPAATPAGCKGAPGSGGGTAKAVGGGTVGGGKLTLRLPRACVGAGKGYKLKLTYKRPARRKRRRKGAFVRVKKVVFAGTGAKRRTDRKAPFTKTLEVKPSATSGGRVRIKVRVTVKRRRAKDRVKTIRASLRVC